MGVLADFRCESCGEVRELGVDAGRPDCPVCKMPEALRRVWSVPAVGRVAGAGGSPARGSA